MKKLSEFISRYIPPNAELTKKLKFAEHELAYTIRSKNILTANNHDKDKRITYLTTALEEQTTIALKQQIELINAGHHIQLCETTIESNIETLKTRLHTLEN